ncbi:MAG: HAD hydrolase-like protein, partial [Anaerolineales bacterium]|nr:HAD hydrolase-like protein [Anaerolineales bacterium]
VVGLDRDVVYADFEAATVHIRRGATFIGTNGDKTFPSELGQVPGNGSLLALIEAATDQKPIVVGKPEQIMFRECLRRLGASATTDNTIMVGDRLETDVLGGQNAGLRSALVLTGVTRREDLAHSDIQPDFVFDDIHALAAWVCAE